MSNTLTISGESHPVDRRNPVLAVALFIVKAAAFWVVLVVGSALASKIVGMTGPIPPQDGPLSITQAFLFINGSVALTLALLASRLRTSGVRMAAVLFVALFCIQTGMALTETWWFNNAVHMPDGMIVAWGEQAVIVAALLGATGALLFRPSASSPVEIPSNLLVRIVALAAIYVAIYYAAGFYIAWASPVVRDYYTAHGNNIPGFLPTVAFQFGRGILWALIALCIVSQLKGSLFSRAAVMMILFSVVTALQLLYPNPMMPWPVRVVHMVEGATSEALYGIVATFVLMAGAARRPLPASSPWRLIVGRA